MHVRFLALLSALALAGCDSAAPDPPSPQGPSTFTATYIATVQDPVTREGVSGVRVSGGWAEVLGGSNVVQLTVSAITDANGRAVITVSKAHPGDTLLELRLAITECPPEQHAARCTPGREWRRGLTTGSSAPERTFLVSFRGDAVSEG